MIPEIKNKPIRSTIFLVLLCLWGIVNGQTIKQAFHWEPTNMSLARESLMAGRYDEAKIRYEACVSHAQANRSAGAGVEGDLIGEYALVLALQGKHELALLNADRARALDASYGDWYASQVLQLVGCEDQARLFSNAAAPSWITKEAVSGIDRQKASVTKLEQIVTRSDLNKVYALQSSGQLIQALALMKALLKTYPDAAVLRSSYSALCEQVGDVGAATDELNRAIALMDPGDPSRATAQQHLQDLMSSRNAPAQQLSWLQRNETRFICYIGGTVAQKTYSLNTRMGLYTHKHWSASANLGATLVDKDVTGSVGLSAYYTLRCFIFGQGITYQFGKNTNVLNLSPSVGLSFLNASQTSSFDVMLGAHVPITGGGKTSVYLSLGKTFYFDFNPKKK